MSSALAQYREKLRTADEAAAMIPLLIGLADPKFRDQLTAEAKRLRYL